MSEPIVSFVLSGGVGSRLWPLSREDNPKQFHDFSGGGSMLEKTLRRLKTGGGGVWPVHTIASSRHADRVHAAMAGVDAAGGQPHFEPVGRNTAAAVALAAQATLAKAGDALVLVVPSDHEIGTDAEFWATVEAGAAAAREGRIVTFGVKPTHPETGYGYIETGESLGGDTVAVRRFVEKPDLERAKSYMEAGHFYWNSGIFLFSAEAMRQAFCQHAPEVWAGVAAAREKAERNEGGSWLPQDLYAAIPSISVDYAIMEKVSGIAMVPARFRWSDLGSWQALLESSDRDHAGNVITGDVIAIDTSGSYLRSQGRLLSVFGMKDVAVISTSDTTFVAPVTLSQNVKEIVERLQQSGRLESRVSQTGEHVFPPGSHRDRVRRWFLQEALPLWAIAGLDAVHGGFHEALALDARPLDKPKRVRTQARQIYTFAEAKAQGWDGPADDIVASGIDFLVSKARTTRGGFVRTLAVNGSVVDAAEDLYDHACVLLALAHAHKAGHREAAALGSDTFAFLDRSLADGSGMGFRETSKGGSPRRSNSHMHLLEATLAWHEITGEKTYLDRATALVELFQSHFFDSDTWTLGEFFADDWSRLSGGKGDWTEPGHHFEWAWLLVDFAEASGRTEVVAHARKLYATAIANGINRSTGLAYGAVSKVGVPLDLISRSWPQTEAIKAALALQGTGGPDMNPEIEARIERLFRWHIDPAPTGLWLDRIDHRGRSLAQEVPASIFYHLIFAFSRYLSRSQRVLPS